MDNPEVLIGAKIISVKKSETFGAEIQEIIVQKDNWFFNVYGTEEYPWVTFTIEKIMCPKCKKEMKNEPPNGGTYGFLCDCGHKE